MPLQQRPLSIDGVQHRTILFEQRSVNPNEAIITRPKVHSPAPAQRPFQVAPATKQTIFWSRVQAPLLIFGCILAGFFVQSLLFGIVAIVLYAILALMLKVPSHITFMLAFMALLTVLILLIVRPDTTLAGNFATYTFLLLVTGVIALAIEARPPKRRKRPKKPERG